MSQIKLIVILLICKLYKISASEKAAISTIKIMTKSDGIVLEDFTGITLGYVTPWNSFGYDQAKKYNNKLNIVSPVWINVKSNLQLTGLHDIDEKWLNHVKSNKNTQIFPRILLEFYQNKDGSNFRSKSEIEKFYENNLPLLGEPLIALAKKYKFNGFVLETNWKNILMQTRDFSSLNYIIDGLIILSKKLKTQNLNLILVIPPMENHHNTFFFNQEHFNKLQAYFLGFSLMTYDYPVDPKNTDFNPNSPIDWIEQNILGILGPENLKKREISKKLLVGLNFYGRTYPVAQNTDNAITANSYKDILSENTGKVTIKWLKNFKEHATVLPNNNKILMYPSVKSINTRLQLTSKYNCGISIWEIGQGFDEFLKSFPDRFNSKIEL